MRATTDDDWGTPVNLGSTINTTDTERDPSISADYLELYFACDRSGGYGLKDIWVTTRPTVSDPWGTPVNLGPTVNSSVSETWPSISADGLSLFFCAWNRPGGGYGDADIWVTTRATVSDPWGAPVNLGPPVNDEGRQQTPSISADGLALFLCGWDDIWVTTRATVSDPWGTPVHLGPPVNTLSTDYCPYISADGSSLYFVSDRFGGEGDFDLWQVPVSEAEVSVADLNNDGIVNFIDFGIFAEDWMWEAPWH
jgi:hypothetical protein